MVRPTSGGRDSRYKKMDLKYLRINKKYQVDGDDIVGIFDIDVSTIRPWTRKFLAAASHYRQVINTTEDLPKSFVLCAPCGPEAFRRQRVYIVKYSAKTLHTRNDRGFWKRAIIAPEKPGDFGTSKGNPPFHIYRGMRSPKWKRMKLPVELSGEPDTREKRKDKVRRGRWRRYGPRKPKGEGEPS